MDPRRALGDTHFMLGWYTDIVGFKILISVADHHVLFRYPLLPPKRPFPYIHGLPATNGLRCPRHCPYCHQGI